ncbi:hypothetical protein RIF29_27703 [Crotalaria pallida]|uniref:Uncharacterized protein n=1 Tax=Crotalaria pallida TaxID=3830 RepID=A0AAN9EQI7_CROPI
MSSTLLTHSLTPSQFGIFPLSWYTSKKGEQAKERRKKYPTLTYYFTWNWKLNPHCSLGKEDLSADKLIEVVHYQAPAKLETYSHCGGSGSIQVVRP